LTQTFKLSNDPQFVEKLVDVVGLYLNPPEHALIDQLDAYTLAASKFNQTSRPALLV
jgi:hypothetical protein